MLGPYLRLALIGIFASLVLGAGVLFFRALGKKSSHQGFDHPLLSDEFLIIAMGGDPESGPPHTQSAYDGLRQRLPHAVLGAEIRRSSDGFWILYGRDRLEDQTQGQGRVSDHALAQLKTLNLGGGAARLLELGEFLDLYGSSRMLLDIQEPRESGQGIAELIRKKGLQKSVFISSPFPGPLRELRKANPDFVFGTDLPKLAQLRFLTALYLESLATIPGDFLVLPNLDEGPEAHRDLRLAQEFANRKKKVFWTMEHNETLQTARERPLASGVLTDRPDCLLKGCTEK